MTTELPDFAELWKSYECLSPGARAELRRVAAPEELSFTTGLYRLFPGDRPHDGFRRLAFLFPWCQHRAGSKRLGTQLAKIGISELRILQALRTREPTDLVQLRRILMHANVSVDWSEFGRTIWFWNELAKRQLIEDFYIEKFAPAKEK